MRRFTQEQVSDQKRLVRGEHLLLARTLLRARDNVHHASWRVLMLAGAAPQGEIGAIRELMPKAQITAVDRDAVCIEAARIAGADSVVCDDLALGLDLPPFDIAHVDLCAGPSDATKVIFKNIRRLVTSRGIFIATFSYGRDVVEAHADALARWRHSARAPTQYPNGSVYSDPDTLRWEALERLQRAGVPDAMMGRLCMLFTPSNLMSAISVMTYRGNEMPMCSVLFQKVGKARPLSALSFVTVAPGDLELAVLFPDVSQLYAVPQERIISLRRQFAARQAVATRKAKKDAAQFIGNCLPPMVDLPIMVDVPGGEI